MLVQYMYKIYYTQWVTINKCHMHAYAIHVYDLLYNGLLILTIKKSQFHKIMHAYAIHDLTTTTTQSVTINRSSKQHAWLCNTCLVI